MRWLVAPSCTERMPDCMAPPRGMLKTLSRADAASGRVSPAQAPESRASAPRRMSRLRLRFIAPSFASFGPDGHSDRIGPGYAALSPRTERTHASARPTLGRASEQTWIAAKQDGGVGPWVRTERRVGIDRGAG